MSNLTPKTIVEELDRYIVGQREAKRAMAVALYNRERRKRLPPELRGEIQPKNILLIGPTGVGKTEIARCLARMIDAPFLKVAATRFTEVGYVGRDVDSIIYELVELGATKAYQQKLREVEREAEKLAVEKILNCLCSQLNQRRKQSGMKAQQILGGVPKTVRSNSTKDEIRRGMAELLQNNQLEDQLIEIEIDNDFEENGVLPRLSSGIESEETDAFLNEFNRNLRHYVEGPRRRKVQVKEARRILTREEANKLLDFDQLIEEAIRQAEENAVVFIDEVDKLTAPKVEIGRDVSGEGVQRDLLPLAEGTIVATRYGSVKTEHILFIAAGTFSQSKPSDLLPEFQGRFPLRVELNPLTQLDFENILVKPQNALIKQYQALLATEGVTLTFSEDGIQEVARIAALMNEQSENIGARRLQTIMEKVLEEVSFTASEREGEEVIVDAAYVFQQAGSLIKGRDLGCYIL